MRRVGPDLTKIYMKRILQGVETKEKITIEVENTIDIQIGISISTKNWATQQKTVKT